LADPVNFQLRHLFQSQDLIHIHLLKVEKLTQQDQQQWQKTEETKNLPDALSIASVLTKQMKMKLGAIQTRRMKATPKRATDVIQNYFGEQVKMAK
jgi:hypothetical protein